MIANVWLIPAFPLAAFLVNGLFGRRWLCQCGSYEALEQSMS
jgi:hypothetical protein